MHQSSTRNFRLIIPNELIYYITSVNSFNIFLHHSLWYTSTVSAFLNKKHKSKHKDSLIYFFAFATPLFMVPQAMEIFRNQSAENVAPITWIFFLIADVVWIMYGIKHKLKPIVYGHILYLFIEGSIVVGIFTYS